MAPLKDLKNSRGGARPGAGMPKGTVTQKTLDKEAARAALREVVLEQLRPLVKAQLDNAMGVSHFLLRDPKSGKFERITDPDQIQAALNADGAQEGSTYYIYTKDPSVQAFTDLMNRTLDKPAEHVEMTGAEGQPLVIQWLE